MKLNQNNFKVAVFAVAAVALSVTTIGIAQPLINMDNSAVNSAYAAEAKRIDDVTATGDIQVNRQSATSIGTDTNIDFFIEDSAQISSGDYIELSFDNLNTRSLVNREIRINDVIVGSLVESAGRRAPNLPFMTYSNKAQVDVMDPSQLIFEDSSWRIVFNDAISNTSNRRFSINITNTSNNAVYSSRPIDFRHSVSVNGSKIAEAQSRTTGIRQVNPRNEIYFNAFYANSVDGEQVNGSFFDFLFRSKGGEQGIKPGDIVEMMLPQDSGVAFNVDDNPKVGVTTTGFSQELWENYGTNIANNGILLRDGSPLKYKVLESSSHKLRYQIVEISNSPSMYQFLPRLTILDTSTDTIDYLGQKLNSLSASSRILRDGQEFLNSERSIVGTISGVRLKAYDQIKKRGSVIVKYIDESGEPLAEEIMLHNKVQEGTKYSAEKKTFTGLEFKKMGEGSAPQDGVVKEGVQNVIFVYGEPTPAPEEPKIEEKTPEIQAPDTGFESQGVISTFLGGLSIMAILTAIFLKKK